MKTKKFDVTDYLTTQEDIDGYLEEIMKENCTPELLAYAITQAEKARMKLVNNTITEQPQTMEGLLYRLLKLGYSIRPPVPA